MADRHPLFAVVLLEDDEVDVESIHRGFRALTSAPTLTVYRSETEALRILRDPQVQLPPAQFVLLLDLNLPGMSELEFLPEIRKDPQLSGTVEFLMTDSTSMVCSNW